MKAQNFLGSSLFRNLTTEHKTKLEVPTDFASRTWNIFGKITSFEKLVCSSVIIVTGLQRGDREVWIPFPARAEFFHLPRNLYYLLDQLSLLFYMPTGDFLLRNITVGAWFKTPTQSVEFMKYGSITPLDFPKHVVDSRVSRLAVTLKEYGRIVSF